jgi:HK97 family phage major capsid protein
MDKDINTPAPAIDEAALNASIEKLTGLVAEKTAAANERINAMEKELSALQQNAAGIPAAVSAPAFRTYGEAFVADKAFQDFKASISGNRHAGFRKELAAAPETTQASNSASRTSLAAPTELGLVTDPRQILNIESLFGRLTVGGSAYQYVKYGYTTTDTATGPAVVAEGAAKPEANYAGTIQTGTVKTIAAWTKMTEQMIADDANIVSFINADMQYQLNKVIDYQLVRGTGSGQLKGLNQSGNYTDYITGSGFTTGDTVIDLVLKVSAQMRAANINNITLLLNPVDWVKVLTAKNVNKDYLIPGIVDSPTQRIWGIPVILSGSVEAGKFHMGDFFAGGKIIERSGIAVEMDREQDDFTKNLMTLRVERRLDFAVVQPKALAYGNFADYS